ncbi:CLUMA_CG001388, isoform A [Clunio marinus]|uniref:CLUMA_CG001388, isoform A n=1 Tax=Clunio marinus TaxID=568069 RepID=A0A1J1HHT0_9DIPT|nr:CLUMA_CG001388, isoform A [Clunio marinus]
MIAAAEPLEFVPRGRKIVDDHPGPLSKKHDNIPNEFVLLDRMQNVNLSKDEHFNENWIIREVYQQENVADELAFLHPSIVNSEQELYYRGNTAVWSKGLAISENEKTSSEICYTSEAPIQFAFFCTKNFLDADYKIECKQLKRSENEENQGVGVIDVSSLKVYSTNGENMMTSIESPISKIWITKYCVIIEKEASATVVDGQSLSMPRVFSLTHPLDDMFPILLKSNLNISYISEAEFKIIFTSENSDIVLLFDARSGKHLVCKLRKATEDETAIVTALYDTTSTTMDMNTATSIGGLSNIHCSLRTTSNIRQNVSGRSTPTSIAAPLLNLTTQHQNSMTSGYKSNLASSLADSILRRNSISVMARKIGECETSKPLVPDLIMEQIWMENGNCWNEYHEMAMKGFLHMDFIGQKYLCFMLVKSYKLNLLEINPTNEAMFGAMTNISAKDAVALPRMNMIAVLLPCGTLMLYSGPLAVGKVHVSGIVTNVPMTTSFNTPGFPKRSSLLPNVTSGSADSQFDQEIHLLSPVQPLQHPNAPLRLNNCTSIKDPAGNRITLSFINGKMYRIALPAMCESSIVRKILIGIRQVLPKESLKLMIRWYVIRNSPGTKDLSLKREWELFKNLLMEMMGRPHEVSSSSNSNVTIGAKKRRKSENGTNSDWEYLLNACQCSHNDYNEDDQEMLQNYLSDASLFPYIPSIFYTTHLLYEDMKLDSSLNHELNLLSEFLYQLSMDFELEEYKFHYVVDNPNVLQMKAKMTILNTDSDKLVGKELIRKPLRIFKEILNLTNKSLLRKLPFIENVNVLSRDIFEILAIIFEKTKNPSDVIERVKIGNDQKMSTVVPSSKKFYSTSVTKIVIDCLLRKNITRTQIERLPIAINYIISQILETARLNPPIGCSAAAYKLLLRPELYAHAAFKKTKKHPKIGRNQQETSLTPRIKTPPDVIAKSEKALVEDDGMEHIDTKLLRLRFPDDLRINDVKKFLNSSKPVIIDIVQLPNVSDHEFIEEQEKQLFAMCTRTMALPVGRGMFTFRTYYPILTELLPIPKLCLTGKETGRGASIEMQQIEVPANMNVWPQFHNGVAAGLRIATDPSEIDPTYIMYNKPKDAEMPPTYAGFLMALGLTSSLKSLSDTYLYDYLIRSEELLSVGLILGMASSYRGTMDTKITRMLSIHIEALLPPTAIELDVSHNVQVASLLGIGLIYQSSNKRFIAEALLQEINRPPGPEMENYVERESYALSAGLALGMVTLATGNKDVGLDDLNLPDMLHYYMTGGTKRPLTGTQREKYKLPSFQIREGDQVNIDVTAPGSTLALGLMFFASDNQAVADWMKPPETMFLLDFVRPDLLLLRVISRGLIMWNSVEPTTEWINSQISKTLSKIIKQKPDPENDPFDMDHEAICQAYCNIVTGAAMVIGLRYAGTQNSIAFKTLKKIITFFLSANGQYIGEYAGKATVESCIILVLIALSLVFAGTGNLQILRMIRMTRARIGPQNSQVTYGSHMAIHMALGFLFLGAGRYTISRKPEAIAALICALFPKFPTHSNDNRYHLQAFRHLYVLAVEPRLFLPRDINSGKLVVCKLSYVEFDQKNLSVTMAPCMLPELETLKAVYINDPNYWPVTFERGRNWDQLMTILEANGCIDIVQRAGCLSHLDDPNRLKSLLVQTLTTEKYSSWKVEAENLLSFSNDRLMINLTKMMLMMPQFQIDDGFDDVSETRDDLRQMILLQAYDCLTRDKIHALGIYMSLDKIIQSINNHQYHSSNCSSDIWQMKIMNELIKKQQANNGASDSSSLLSLEILNSLLMRFKMLIDKKFFERKSSIRQFLMKKDLNFLQDSCFQSVNELMQLVIFYDLPLNYINETLDLSNINLFQFMFEIKKRQHDSTSTEFFLNLWKILKD